mgnify:FL=1
MSGLKGFWDEFKAGFGDIGDEISGDKLLALGLSYAAKESGLFSPNIPQTGYQGGIPKYTAVRQQVPQQGMPDRRPGQSGQRYFTDTMYAQKPEDEAVPTLEEAQAAVAAQTAAIESGQPIPTLAETQAAVAAQAAAEAAAAPVETPPAQELAAGGLAGLYGNDRLSPYARREEEKKMAAGGMTTSPGQGYYLGGTTDGMADEVKANIDGKQEARLSDGEFVIPADVVSHLGNGNSDAGAKQLHSMMDNVRKERTGNVKQGKEINPNQFMPKMAQGGIANYYGGGAIKKFEEGGEAEADPGVGKETGNESSLSNWAGEYVTDMLGKGQALSTQPYEAYTGPLTAGQSSLQDQAFTGIGGLQTPTGMGGDYNPGTFDSAAQQQYMNPYMQGSLNPQLRDARRQAEISRIADAGRMTKAGAFGGSRQAIMEAEGSRNLMQNQQDIIAQGYNTAFQNAQQQFNTEQDRSITAQDKTNQYGKDILGLQADAGAIQRGITSEGIAADQAAFEEERDFPYRQVQFQQSLLQGMPLTANTTQYSQPSDYSELQNLMADYYDIFGNPADKKEEEEKSDTSSSEGV